MINCRYFTFLLLFFVSLFSLEAQVTEMEVRIQEIFLKGTQANLMGEFDKAEEFFKSVLTKDPKNGMSAFELSRALEKQDKNDEAIKYAKRAIEIDENNKWFKLFLADLYQKTEDNRAGANVYQQLVAEYPHFEEYYLKQAFFLVRDGAPAEAIKIYETLEAKIGINEELTRRKHTLLIGTGDADGAANELKKLIAAFPKNKTYQHLLADFYIQANQMGKAQKVYKDILKMDPEDAAAKLAIAGEMKKSGNDSEYLTSLKPIFENQKVGLDMKIKELIPMIQRVAKYNDATLADEALQLCNILDEVHPEQAKVQSIAGDLYYYSNRKQEARKYYEKTLELDETVYLVWEQLLYSQRDLGDHKAMLKTSEEAMDVFPNQGAIYYLNGYAAGAEGDYADALTSLQQAAMMSSRNLPLNLDVKARMGWTYTKMKKYDKALSQLETAVKKSNGNHPVALENLGDLLFLQGKTKAAVDNWKEALKIFGTKASLERKIAEKALN